MIAFEEISSQFWFWVEKNDPTIFTVYPLSEMCLSWRSESPDCDLVAVIEWRSKAVYHYAKYTSIQIINMSPNNNIQMLP